MTVTLAALSGLNGAFFVGSVAVTGHANPVAAIGQAVGCLFWSVAAVIHDRRADRLRDAMGGRR